MSKDSCEPTMNRISREKGCNKPEMRLTSPRGKFWLLGFVTIIKVSENI